jgi:hypothetical protein
VIAIANVAYTRLPRDDGSGNPERRDILRVSAAYGRDVTENLRLLVDTAVARHPDPSIATWPAVVLVGAIAHLPWGFDVDVGYQARLNRAAPANVWLAGMTFHW